MTIKKFKDLEEAVLAAALQNFQRDVLLEIADPTDWEEIKESYLDEARHILITTGENYEPDFDDHFHIHLENWRIHKPVEQ